MNREGLTFAQWLAAANYGRDQRWSDTPRTRAAWRRGDDPCDFAAFPDSPPAG